MRSTPELLLLAGLFMCSGAWAQSEQLRPLNAQPRGVQQGSAKNASNELFLYMNLPQVLPVVDDFSIDRTRQRNAEAGDAGVTLQETVYRLEVNGISLPDQAFRTDTTYQIVVDLTDPDTVITTFTPLPSEQVTVRDLSQFPSPVEVVTAWPPYSVRDTVNDASSDTTFFTPDLVQDTLFVYAVAADPRTYIQADNSQVPLILWEDDDVFVNGTYPVDPPTIGVATFEGLDRTGMPYERVPATSYGIADHLTSVPIDLALQPSDSVYLSFFYQPQGLSGDDQVQEADSLILEFYAPDEDVWERVWRTPYGPLAPFQQVMLPITDTRFLKPDFRMRFLNYATLSGALDHWHLDYVRLGKERSYTDTLLIDVAFVMPEAGLLQTYTSVPFSKFEQAPASYMAPSVSLFQKNLADQDRFITYGVRSALEGSGNYTGFGSGNNTSNNANSTFASTHAVGANAPPFAYDPGLSQDDAFWDVQFHTNATPDINRYNDTARFVQELSNYYAYDDGTAEAGYGLTNAPGGKIACRFDTQGGDSLRAIRMYFDPIFYPSDPSTASFLVTVWSSLSPETIIHQNFSFSSPEYRPHGLNKFVEYPLDSAIYVENTFFIGWVQTGPQFLNLGFDKNRNNQDKIFYNVAGSFVNTGFEGSLMMRPVMVSATDPWAGMNDRSTEGTGHLQVYPVPAWDRLNVVADDGMDPRRYRIMDAMGRILTVGTYRQGHAIDVSVLPNGVYVLGLEDDPGIPIARSTFVVQR
ncbi:MAG: T9SS type A sorting domain-containing protein [Flavobacteriales bacterium]|nr:T9SS type A sorting domain-containing protein [Flavobacteriales bacterium]